MPARRPPAPVRRKHSLGNLRRAHPASGATWNVQVVRGKMSSKCLWHACRALVLGLTLMLLGAGMATIGYYADQLSVASEVRGNATVRVKNESKGFHLNNLSYVGPIVMGFGGFIVVASCVMTFEARDSAAKVVPARLKATTNSIQHQATRWDHHLGVFRSSPADPPPQPPPLDRQALTAALVHFSKSISSSSRFSPKLRRLSHTGSVPNLSTLAPHPYANAANLSHLLSPNRKTLHLGQRRHRHQHHQHPHQHPANGGRHLRARDRGARISSSLVQRATRESSAVASLLQPLPPAHRLYWHALSIDESATGLRPELNLNLNLSRNLSQSQASRIGDRTKRSDTAKRHVLARQKPIEREDEERARGPEASPLGHRRSSTMSDSSFSGRWTYRCASITSRASSIDSRKIQVDMHSPEAMPKSILRSPKRFNSGASTTPSVEKEFRSQLSVCSEPPAPIRQLSGQSSLEPCLPEESPDLEEKLGVLHRRVDDDDGGDTPETEASAATTTLAYAAKKPRPATLPLADTTTTVVGGGDPSRSCESHGSRAPTALHRSNSSRTFYRAKGRAPLDAEAEAEARGAVGGSLRDHHNCDSYDSLRVINERRHKLLKTESETALIERKASTAAATTTAAATMKNFDYTGSQQQAELDRDRDHDLRSEAGAEAGAKLEAEAEVKLDAEARLEADAEVEADCPEEAVQRCHSVELEPAADGRL